MPPGTIDSHVHIGLDAYGPVETFVETMGRLGLHGAVLVARQWQFDSRELLAAAARYPERFRVIAGVDALAADAIDRLDELVAEGIVGIRVDPEWLLSDLSLWRRVRDSGLIVSVTPRISIIASPAFRSALDALGGTTIRLEHLGGLRPGAMPPDGPEVRAVLGLADRPDVMTMWSGLWLNAGEGWPYRVAQPLLGAVIDAFTPERICWSGDWNRPAPPIGSHIDDAAYAAEAQLPGILAGDAGSMILSATPARLFGLGAVSGAAPVRGVR